MKKPITSEAVKYLISVDPILGAIIERIEIQENQSSRRNHYKSLVELIISQQLSVKAADTIFKRFIDLFVKNGVIKSIRNFPTPENVLEMSDAKLRSAGLSTSKVNYLKDLSLKIQDRQIDLNKLHKMSDEEVIEYLMQVKGIGRWTGEMFLMFNLLRPDIFSHGDLGLRNGIKKLYKFKDTPTEKEIEKIVRKWSPYRTLASRYLWKSLEL